MIHELKEYFLERIVSKTKTIKTFRRRLYFLNKLVSVKRVLAQQLLKPSNTNKTT